MRTLLVCLAVFALLAPGARAAPERHTHKSVIRVGEASFRLRTVAREATLHGGLAGVLVHYTVHRDGTFLHPRDADGGRLVGCRYASRSVAEMRARPFPDEKQPIGWLLEVGAICGNTFSHRVRLITIAEHGDGYREATFESKYAPIIRRRGDRVEIWGFTQHWGAGGTASSLFLPYLHVVLPDGAIARAALPPDVAAWPKLEYGLSPKSRFVAGVMQENPALLRAVLKDWAHPPPIDQPDPFGLPYGREALTEIATAVEDLVRARATLKQKTASFR